MNVKAYIESGAIEAYVLGLASAEECAELEMLRKQYAEIDNAITAFEMQMENTAMAEAVAPPAFIKEELNRQLFGEESDNKVVVMAPASSPGEVKPFWKYVAAASVILFIISAGFNFYFYDRYKTADNAYKDLFAETKTLQAKNDFMNTRLDSMSETMRIISDPTVLAVSMNSMRNDPSFKATVYWDTKTKDVYLLSNHLPAAPAGKQYQLWAIVDGVPVDAGMMNDCAGVCYMKNIQKAQAFAVTLEQAGGKPKPEGEMYVLGKI